MLLLLTISYHTSDAATTNHIGTTSGAATTNHIALVMLLLLTISVPLVMLLLLSTLSVAVSSRRLEVQLMPLKLPNI